MTNLQTLAAKVANAHARIDSLVAGGGVGITGTDITNSTFQGSILAGTTVTSPVVTGGSLTETMITFDSGGGLLLLYTSTTTSVTQTVAGDYQFTVPAG